MASVKCESFSKCNGRFSVRIDRHPPITMALVGSVVGLYVGDYMFMDLSGEPERSMPIFRAITGTTPSTSILYSSTRGYAPWLPGSLPTGSLQGGSGVLSYDRTMLSRECALSLISELSARAPRIDDRLRVILSRELPSSMWGYSEATQLLDSARGVLLDLVDYIYDIESSVAHLQRPHRKRVPDYVSMEQALSVMLEATCGIIGSLYSISRIDKFFDDEVKTPARWFFPGNVIDDFRESYSFMVSIILAAPQLRSALA